MSVQTYRLLPGSEATVGSGPAFPCFIQRDDLQRETLTQLWSELGEGGVGGGRGWGRKDFAEILHDAIVRSVNRA